MKITLSHGNGGLETAELINAVFMPFFVNEHSRELGDSAILDVPVLDGPPPKLLFTTDSFVVRPLFFPGGDIGRLAVCGAVNDILASGGKPLYLSAAFVIEEGLDTETLERVAASMKSAADEAGVSIVAGDTKVIESAGKDREPGLFITASGVGFTRGSGIRLANIRENNAIIVTGNLGGHHACILSQRLGAENAIESDATPLVDVMDGLRQAGITPSGARDITRGGLGTVLNEAAASCGLRAEVWEDKIPVSPAVREFCGYLGLDPLYMGNEGKMFIAVDAERADEAVEIIRKRAYGADACVIGRFTQGQGVVLNTKIGGRRVLPVFSGEGLPRIC